MLRLPSGHPTGSGSYKTGLPTSDPDSVPENHWSILYLPAEAHRIFPHSPAFYLRSERRQQVRIPRYHKNAL